MSETLEFVVRHGVAVLFGAVFVEELGVPLPAAPLLLAAGALAGEGRLNWLTAVIAAAAGSMLGDLFWFYLGRYRGQSVLKLLCRISLEPDSCARKTQDLFKRFGMPGVILAKFVPGLGTLAPPLAGSSGISAPRFFFFDGLGSLLYAGSYIVLGVLFSRQLDQLISSLAGLGTSAFGVVIGLAAIYIGYKYFKRQKLLKELRMARITVDELLRMQESGENPVILDLRDHEELDQDASLIRGALHMALDEVEHRHHEIPRDRDIILYCSCPNEVSSARVALVLHRRGFSRVRPLLGGIDAWRERNYPTQLRPAPNAKRPK